MDAIDCLIVGAGVIGLAAARELALRGREVLVVEAADRIGSQTSSRSSEVIHAGLHHAPGSLKARLCVEGRERLYAHCRRHGVAHRACGKLIVATSEAQIGALEAIADTAARNGLRDLRRLDRGEIAALEPELRAAAALLSPSTGILDSHAYMLSLQGEAEAHGAIVALRTAVTGIAPQLGRLAVRFDGEAAPRVLARTLVNAAGLSASEVADAVEGLAAEHRPRTLLAKGSYFALQGRSPFGRLVYPVPEPGGLGVHLTLDLAGGARFGPDVEWVDHLDHAVDLARVERFYAAVRAYWPALENGQLIPAYAGIRPKLRGPGEPAADFRIDGPAEHGIAGLINLFGIESPGLTASLAIGRLVADLVTGTRASTCS